MVHCRILFTILIFFCCINVCAMEDEQKIVPEIDPELAQQVPYEVYLNIVSFLPPNHRLLNERIRKESFPREVAENIACAHIKNIIYHVQKQRASCLVAPSTAQEQYYLLDKVKNFMHKAQCYHESTQTFFENVWNDLLALDEAIPHIEMPTEYDLQWKGRKISPLKKEMIKQCLQDYEDKTHLQLKKYFLPATSWHDVDRDTQQDAQEYIQMRQYFLSLIATRLHAYKFYDHGCCPYILPAALCMTGSVATPLPYCFPTVLCPLFSAMIGVFCAAGFALSYTMCDVCKKTHHLPNYNENYTKASDSKIMIKNVQRALALPALLKKYSMEQTYEKDACHLE